LKNSEKSCGGLNGASRFALGGLPYVFLVLYWRVKLSPLTNEPNKSILMKDLDLKSWLYNVQIYFCLHPMYDVDSALATIELLFFNIQPYSALFGTFTENIQLFAPY